MVIQAISSSIHFAADAGKTETEKYGMVPSTNENQNRHLIIAGVKRRSRANTP